MNDKLKYIISEDDQFMIFSPTIHHKNAARALQAHVFEKIIGAGFMTVDGGCLCCNGYSESLGGIQSRGETDAKIIADALSLEIN